ncbi:MAG TPA: DUF3482 domain-containing protein [Casimicrobiaceae bacterium]|nr:DUF3482 domain-containing protein [Casimicrobiaceae bacterium]
MTEAIAISLSLISHTNAGKTALARTLVGRDVGEVRDAPHVTQVAAPYPLITTTDGDSLILWDTPGFGDSARLARRLAQQGNPIGWFLSQVWDRFRDRTLWLSQQAVRNVRDEADVVLYLVNAAEAPEDSGFLVPELAVLDWIGKPVIVLLNQTGRPRPRDEEAQDEARWRAALGARSLIRSVITLDAFARCWVQEISLLRTIGEALSEDKRAGFARLAGAWQARRLQQFDDAMNAITLPIAMTAWDSEAVPDQGMRGALQTLGKTIGFARNDEAAARNPSSEALAKRLDSALRESTDRLISIHELGGHATADVLARLTRSVDIDAPMNEGAAAAMAGVVSGALTGLAADVAAGGLTFGAGMLTGALLGALGGASIARGMNLARGTAGTLLRWDDAFLSRLVTEAILRYLAVAHYGRGRGDWVETEYPAFWKPLVSRLVEQRSASFTAAWSQRQPECNVDSLVATLRPLIFDTTRDVLIALYPDARAAFTPTTTHTALQAS